MANTYINYDPIDGTTAHITMDDELSPTVALDMLKTAHTNRKARPGQSRVPERIVINDATHGIVNMPVDIGFM